MTFTRIKVKKHLEFSRRSIITHGIDYAGVDCSAKIVGFTRGGQETRELFKPHDLVTLAAAAYLDANTNTERGH